MKTILESQERDDVVRRIARLAPSNLRRWGTMSLEAMLSHVSDQLRFATRERTPLGPRGPLTWAPVKWFVIVIAPWPKGRLSASSELLSTPPLALAEARQETIRLIERFIEAAAREELGQHPMFGHLSRRLWGHLAWRHLDYHLRQFGA